MKFSEQLWDKIEPIYQKILAHPFITELGDGTLSRKRFVFYIEQDARYLIEFSKALALIAGRSISIEQIKTFLNFSMEVLRAELDLHLQYVSPPLILETPACRAYTSYLLATASTSSLEEAIAAVLPCFWIYREVGKHLLARAKKAHPYADWIATYSNQEFSESTDKAIYILDKASIQASACTKQRMKAAFHYSALMEWRFWNDAYEMTHLAAPSLQFFCDSKDRTCNKQGK